MRKQILDNFALLRMQSTENASKELSDGPRHESHFLEKPKSVRAMEILHQIAKSKIKRLEGDCKELRTNLILNSANYQNPKLRPILLFQELERALKEMKNTVNQKKERLEEIERNNKENPLFKIKDLSDVKETISEKG